jgi:hypothetical protein
MEEDTNKTTGDDEPSGSTFEGVQRQEDVVGVDEPVGPDNIREGKVRGTMHGGPTKSEGQGQGG